MGGSGFFKGEKKKHKKEKSQQLGNTSPSMGAPTFRMPEIVTKKNKNQ
jgi:hypothetical protein